MSSNEHFIKLIRSQQIIVQEQFEHKTSVVMCESTCINESKNENENQKSINWFLNNREWKTLFNTHDQALVLNDKNELHLVLKAANFIPQRINIEQIDESDAVSCGFIIENKSTAQRKYILIGTKKGKIVSCEKNFSKITTRCLLDLQNCSIYNILMEKYLIICCQNYILTFDQSFKPVKKYGLPDSKEKYIKTIQLSVQKVAFIFENEFFILNGDDIEKFKIPNTIFYASLNGKTQTLVFASLFLNSGVKIFLFDVQNKIFNFNLQLNLENEINMQELQIDFSANWELSLISNGKKYLFYKVENEITTNAAKIENSGDNLFQSKIGDLNMLPQFDHLFLKIFIQNNLKKMNFDEILENKLWTLEFKKTFFELAMEIAFEFLSPWHEKILEIHIKSRKPNKKFTLPLISESNSIHIERALKMCKLYDCTYESVYLCLKMGAFREAFKEAYQENNDELMLMVLRKALNFEEDFVFLFTQYLKQMHEHNTREDINEEFIYLLAHHPDPLQCFELLPPKWLNNKHIIRAITQIFDRYMLDISSLELFRSIQIQERLRALEERNQPGKRFNLKEENCSFCLMSIIQHDVGVSEVFWVRPMIITFSTCNHMYHISCIESAKKNSSGFYCMKCTQK